MTTQKRTVKDVDFGIFFFASSVDSLSGKDVYRLLVESARFADRHGFSSVWVPERHFTEFGFIYPNPAQVLTALSTITERIRLCAGSLVSPLHNVVRVVEEWSVLDNLSKGRIGASFAPGWNPDDFVLYPERYNDRREENFANVERVRKLWADQSFTARNGLGKSVELKIFPPPYSAEFPMWVTASGNPDTFKAAGALGANVLTHLLDQDLAALAHKIDVYRAARAEHGFDPASGVVTAMIHTFVGADRDAIREEARAPYCQFLKQNIGLAQGLAADRGHRIDVRSMSEKDIDTFLTFLYDRFVFDRAFIGNPESCVDLAGKIYASGVDELGCLLDFGPAADRVLENLPHLERLKTLCQALPEAAYSRQERAIAVRTDTRPAQKNGAQLQLPDGHSDMAAVRKRLPEEMSGTEFYAQLSLAGWAGESGQAKIQTIWRRDGEALGLLEVSEAGLAEGWAGMLLEECFAVAIAASSRAASEQAAEPWLPVGFRSLQSRALPPSKVWVHALLHSGPESREELEVDLWLRDDAGNEVAVVHALKLQRAQPEPTEEDVGDWLYGERWHVSPSPSTATEQPGHWVVFTDQGGLGERVAEELRQAGHTCSLMKEGRDLRLSLPDDVARLRATFRSRLDGELKSPNCQPAKGFLFLWGLDATRAESTTPESLMSDQFMACGGLTLLVQALLATEDVKLPRLWIATRGVKSIESSAKHPLEVAQAPLWGIGKTCAVEHPELWGGLVDLDPQASLDDSARALGGCLLAGDREDQVAVRNGERHVVRVVHELPPSNAELIVHGDASYLITGGLKGFGFEVARWLVGRGAKNLILPSRRALPGRDEWKTLKQGDARQELIHNVLSLEKLGARVHSPTLDVTNEQQVRALCEGLEAGELPALRGVFHCAAVWSGENGQTVILPLSMTEVSSIGHVFPPKVVGSWLLGRYLEGRTLDFFVTFSAAAGLLGSAGQVVYTAANSFMDTLAHDLAGRGVVPATSINWGPIKEIGSGATLEGRMMHQLAERRGLLGIPPEKAMQALELLLPQRIPQIGVMHTNWELLVRSYTGMLSAPWASELVGQMPAVEQEDLVASLKEAAPEDRTELLCTAIQRLVVMVMGYTAAEAPEPDQGLFELGLDSLLALELKNHIQNQIRKDFPATAIFDYPTIGKLAVYLITQVLSLPIAAAAARSGPVRAKSAVDEIDQLSEAEVEARLARQIAAGAAQ